VTRCQDLRLLVGIVTPEVAAVQRATSTDAKDPTQTASANQRLGHSTALRSLIDWRTTSWACRFLQAEDQSDICIRSTAALDRAVLEPSRGLCSPGEEAEQPCGTPSQERGLGPMTLAGPGLALLASVRGWLQRCC
jgi:hypothetical protein